MNGVLSGKVAIITGAGSGIAAAAARLFHAEGASVVLADVSGRQDELARELGQRAVACHVDVARDTDVEAMVDLAIQQFGRLDVLCNVAGITGPRASIEEILEEDFDRVISVNVRGLLLTMKHALPHLIESGAGSIVNISSTAALIGMPGLAVYAATKGAAISVTRVVAVEYASRGVRANVVCPGGIETPIVAEHMAKNPAAVEKQLAAIPAGRLGQPEDIARAMLFLASDASSYVNGAIIPVDGAQTAL